MILRRQPILVVQQEGNGLRRLLIDAQGTVVPDDGRTGAAVVLVPSSHVTLRHWLLPATSAAQARQMATLQARQALPWPLDAVWLDLTVRRLPDGTYAVLATAVHREAIEAALSALEAQGLELAALAIRPLLWAGLVPMQGTWTLTTPDGTTTVRDGLVTAPPGGHPVERWFVPTPQIPPEPTITPPAGDATTLAAIAAAQAHRRGQGPTFDDLVQRQESLPASARRLAGLTMAGLVVLAWAGTLAWGWLHDERTATVQAAARLETLRREAHQSRAVAAATTSVAARLTALRERIEERGSTCQRLRLIMDALPAGVRLVKYEATAGGSLVLDGQSRDSEGPLVLMELLRQGLGRTPSLESLQRTEDGSARFRLSLPAEDAVTSHPQGGHATL